MNLTLYELQQIIPDNTEVETWHEALSEFLPQYELDTKIRIAHFLAQCCHESQNFTRIRENLNYRWQTLRRVFPRHFPTDEIAQQYAHKPQQIANRAYANRMGNGSESSGDGYRFSGRGLIQLTGRNNYTLFGNSIDMTAEQVSDYLETYRGAAHSACWFWQTNNLNLLADTNDLVAVTRRVNGGTNGLEDRAKHFEHILEVLNANDGRLDQS